MDNISMPIGSGFSETVDYVSVELQDFGDKTTGVINDFQKKIWPYIRESALVIRHSLRLGGIIINYPSEVIVPITYKIRILSSISFGFAIKASYQAFETLEKNIRLNDPEGIVLSIISVISALGGTVDEFSTMINSLYLGFGVTSLAEISKFFDPVGTPIVIGLLSHKILRSVYNSIMHAIEVYDLPTEVTAETLEEIKALLAKKLGVTPEEQALNEHILTRHTDDKIVKIMKSLRDKLNADAADPESANRALRNIKTLTIRKLGLNALTGVFDVAMLTSLVAVSYYGYGPAATAAVGAVRAGASIVVEVCQTKLMEMGLEDVA